MCLLLHVLQPLRDLVWLLRGGPPPGPAILYVMDSGEERIWGLWGREGEARVCRRV